MRSRRRGIESLPVDRPSTFHVAPRASEVTTQGYIREDIRPATESARSNYRGIQAIFSGGKPAEDNDVNAINHPTDLVWASVNAP